MCPCIPPPSFPPPLHPDDSRWRRQLGLRRVIVSTSRSRCCCPPDCWPPRVAFCVGLHAPGRITHSSAMALGGCHASGFRLGERSSGGSCRIDPGKGGWAQCSCGCGAMQAPRLTREERLRRRLLPLFTAELRGLHSGPASAPRPYARGHDADFAGRNSAVCCAQFLLLCRVRVGCGTPTHHPLRVERITAGVHAPLAHNTGRKAPAVKAQWR